jgi:hypothetical protein
MNGNRIIGGASAGPNKKDFWYAAKSSYQPNSFKTVDDYTNIYDGRTMDAFVNESKKEVLVGIRGTKDPNDVASWPNIALSNLENSSIFNEDLKQFAEITNKYPPEQYKYFLAGHSLGGAITAVLIRKFPFIKEAQVFNSAVETSELRNPSKKIKYNYIDKDPLYNLEGRLLKTPRKKVYRYHDMGKEQSEGFLNSLKPSFLKAHKLDQFRKYIVDVTPQTQGTVINQEEIVEGGAKKPYEKEEELKEVDMEPDLDLPDHYIDDRNVLGFYAFDSDAIERNTNYLNFLEVNLNSAIQRYEEEYDRMTELERTHQKQLIEGWQNRIENFKHRIENIMEDYLVRTGQGLKGGISNFNMEGGIIGRPNIPPYILYLNIKSQIADVQNDLRNNTNQYYELLNLGFERKLTDSEKQRKNELLKLKKQFNEQLLFLRNKLNQLLLEHGAIIEEQIQLEGGRVPLKDPIVNPPLEWEDIEAIQTVNDENPTDALLRFVEENGMMDEYIQWLYDQRELGNQLEGGCMNCMNDDYSEYGSRSIYSALNQLPINYD